VLKWTHFTLGEAARPTKPQPENSRQYELRGRAEQLRESCNLAHTPLVVHMAYCDNHCGR